MWVFAIGKIMGQVGDGGWVQVHDFTPEPGPKLARRGRLIALISASDGLDVGRETITHIHELYYGQLEASPLDQMRSMLSQLHEENPHTEIICLGIVDNVIYLGCQKGGIWVKRPDKEGWIANITSDAIQVLAGTCTEQTIVLGNGAFWDCLPLGVVRSSLDDPESLLAVVHGNSRGVGAGGVIIKITTPQASMTKPQDTNKFQISNFKFQMPQFSGPVFINHTDQEKNRRRMLYLGLGFVVLTLVLAIVGMFRQRDLAKKQSVEFKQMQQAQSQFEEARAIVELNPVRSRELLEQIKDQRSKIKNFDEVYDQAQGIRRPKAEEVINLQLLREDLTLSQIALGDEGKLIGLDSAKGRVVSIDPVKKSGSIIAGNLKNARLLATYPDKILVLTDDGVIQTSNSKVLVAKSQNWDEILDMDVYADTVYLLAKDDIYRSGKKWTDEGLDLSDQTNMAIDGSIWILDQGRVSKYTRGTKDSFGTSELLSANAQIFTKEDYKNLYILDRTTGKIIVLNKQGELMGQYIFDLAKTAVDLAVDETGGKIYLIEGSKIWVVNL